MKLAIVSDIHGNLPALEAVFADARAAGVDGFLNLGDILAGPLWPRETAAWLMAQDWPTIAGNHERQMLVADRSRMGASDAFAAAAITDTQARWLASLPAVLTPVPGLPGLACLHGMPAADHEPLLHSVEPAGIRDASDDEILARMAGTPAAALWLCGHSHLPRERRVGADGSLHIANPGSVGLPAYDHDQPFEHLVENGSPDARYALIAPAAGGGWQVELRAVAYDHASAARRAEANGFGDWADALRTGRVGRRAADRRPAAG